MQEQLDAGRRQLGDVDTLALLDAIGLPILRTEVATDVDEAAAAAASMGYMAAAAEIAPLCRFLSPWLDTFF